MATNIELAHATASATLAPKLTFAGVVARFVRTKPLGAAGAVIILAMLALALFAELLAPYDPYVGDYALQFARPSAQHWVATHAFGRDVLSRIMYGARIPLRRILRVVHRLHHRRAARRGQRVLGRDGRSPARATDGHPAGVPAADPGAGHRLDPGPGGAQRGDRDLDPRHPARGARGAGGRDVGQGERLRRGGAGARPHASPRDPSPPPPDRPPAVHHHAGRAARRRDPGRGRAVVPRARRGRAHAVVGADAVGLRAVLRREGAVDRALPGHRDQPRRVR